MPTPQTATAWHPLTIHHSPLTHSLCLVELDDEVCLCFHVSKRKILNHLRIHRPRVPSQLAECGGAGTGCGWCVPFLKKYFRDAQAGPAGTPDELTAADYATQRGRYIREGKGTPPAGATPPPEDSA